MSERTMNEVTPQRIPHWRSPWLLLGLLAVGLIRWSWPSAANSAVELPPAFPDRTAATAPELSQPAAIHSEVTAEQRGAVPSPPANAEKKGGAMSSLGEQFRASLPSAWSDEFYGHRVFLFQKDGTATMTLELDSVGRALYGPKLTFFVAWELKDDVLHLQMRGGEPAGTAVTLAKLFGEKSSQRIEKVTSTELHLRSLDSQKLYVHRRVEQPQ